ncbi:CBN-LPR-4 protein [Caenorhabditis brenneri]|uniref:CBN-LPR-4 protein n=1 Tax=Caenorhabditis brenneri TaxID=135651 RepID=G0MI48_CAEBE|nr:CBN-LPR-4 protein [Caenorhabditis brenneri]
MQLLTAAVFACLIGGVFLAAPDAPTFDSLPAGIDPTAKVGPPGTDDKALVRVGEVAESILDKLGFSTRDEKDVRRAPVPSSFFGSDDVNQVIEEANANRVDLQGITSGQIPGLAPIPVPGFPGPQDAPVIPGVNTIPGLSNFNYLVGQLFPQMIPPANTLLGSSISRILPKDTAKNIAKDVFRAVHPTAENVDTARMMGRWFQVINSPHVIREACTVSHFGALTNNTYSASFTILKFYREGNPNGSPRYALGYGFKSGETGQFVLHNSNSADAEPFWVIKMGPLNEYKQYDYAIVSTWVRYPVFVIARDPERFRKLHMKNVLEFLQQNNYINVMTKAFNMISPVDYEACQYTPTFSGTGK